MLSKTGDKFFPCIAMVLRAILFQDINGRQRTDLDLDGMLEQVKNIIITRGKDGADVYAEGKEYHIPTVPE